MRWPWVNQEALSQTIALLVGKFSEMSIEKDRQWQERYDALLEKYHSLKLVGAVTPPPPDPPVRQPLSTDLADEEWAMEDEAKPVEAGPFREDDD